MLSPLQLHRKSFVRKLLLLLIKDILILKTIQLKQEQPDVIIAAEMQDNFGGTKSFDWAIKDQSGTTGSVPGFQTFNTIKEKK